MFLPGVVPVQLLVDPVQLLVDPVQLLVVFVHLGRLFLLQSGRSAPNHILKVVGAVQPLLKYWFRLEVDPVQLLVDTVQLLVDTVLPPLGQCFCLV